MYRRISGSPFLDYPGLECIPLKQSVLQFQELDGCYVFLYSYHPEAGMQFCGIINETDTLYIMYPVIHCGKNVLRGFQRIGTIIFL